jgi:hypothetical protein
MLIDLIAITLLGVQHIIPGSQVAFYDSSLVIGTSFAISRLTYRQGRVSVTAVPVLNLNFDNSDVNTPSTN